MPKGEAPMTPQPQHCDHECVCKEYRDWYESAEYVDQLCPYSNECDHYRPLENCDWDEPKGVCAECEYARPHPSPAPTGCPYWNPEANLYPEEPDNHCNMQFSKRDAAIVAATLKKFEYIEQLHMDGVSYPDLYNEFIQTYNSLRSTPPAPEREVMHP